MNKLYLKKIVLGLFLVMFTIVVNGQINNPVKWSYTAHKIANKTYELRMTAIIDGNWHLYAQDAGEGPEPTTISFSNNPLVIFEGKIKEVGKMEKSYDKNFNSVLKYYAHKVEFVQKIKVKASVATVVNGTVTYMVCNDRQCLPPKEIPFSISVK